MSKILYCALFIALTTLLACTSGPTAMTNEEYATAFCAIDSGTGATDATTWGQMKEALNTVQNDLNSLNPPEDFREFHNAKVAGVEVVAKFADKQPKDDAHNPFLFIGDPATMAIIGAIEVAEQDLSVSAREALVRAGCDLQ